MFKKAKLFSLLAVIVASTVVGLFSFPQTANAQSSSVPTAFIPEDMPATIDAKMMREAMIKCLAYIYTNGTAGDIRVSKIDLNNGNWFQSGSKSTHPVADTNLNVGYFTEPIDGRLVCNEGEGGNGFVKKFMEIYGIGSYAEAACSLGFKPYYYTDDVSGFFVDTTPISGTDCVATTKVGFTLDQGKSGVTYRYSQDVQTTRDTIDSLYPTMLNQEYGTGYPGNNSRYAMYLQAFFAACNPGSGFLGDAPATGTFYGPVKIVSGPLVKSELSATITEVYYPVGDGAKNPVYTRILGNDSLENEDISCGAIVAEINRYAPGYAQWVYEAGFTDEQLRLSALSETNCDDDGSCDADSQSSCRVDGIGWLVCPLMNFMARLVDGTYEILENSLLQTEPLIIGVSDEGDAKTGLYESWKMMRDFANIAFVITFLVIVFSQLTSFGVSNYGIKRLLPKLIVSAVMVNLSYFVCAIAIDLSNLLGSSLKDLFDGVAKIPDIKPGALGDGGGVSGAVGWTAITITALAAGGLAGGPLAVLALLVPLLFSALGAVVTVVLVLVLRQVLIIILVVIAPLAFVALLLPNTESYFSRWRSTFTTMLLLYPIIAIIFGASNLASKIIMASSEQVLVQLMGAAAAVIPLAITPMIMRFAGGLLNRFAGIVNNREKGPIDGMRNRSMKGVERMQNKQNLNTLRSGRPGRVRGFLGGGSKYIKGVEQEGVDAGVESEISRAKTDYKANLLESSPDYAAKVAGGSDVAAVERVVANAQFTLEKLELDEVKAAGVTVAEMNFSQLAEILNPDNTTSSAAQKAAAAERMITISDPEKYEKYVDHYASEANATKDTAIIRSTMGQALAKSNPALKSSDIDNVTNGKLGADKVDDDGNPTGEKVAANLSTMVATNAGNNVISEAKMATMSPGDLKYAFDAAQKAASWDGGKSLEKLTSTANKLLVNPQLNGNIQHNESQIREIATADVKTLVPEFGAPSPTASVSAPTMPRGVTPGYIKAETSPQKIEVAVNMEGGMTAMSDSNVVAIAREHRSHSIGQEARIELNQRRAARKAPPPPPVRPDDV